MAKFTIYLVAVVLTAVIDAGLSEYTGRYKNWDQFHSQDVGFASGKCSAMSSILPEAQSGCCGKQVGGDEDNQDGEDNTDNTSNQDEDQDVDADGNNNNDDDGILDDDEVSNGDEFEDNHIGDGNDNNENEDDDIIDSSDEDFNEDYYEIEENENNVDDDSESGDGYGFGDLFDETSADTFDNQGFNDLFDNINGLSGESRVRRSVENDISGSDVAPDKFIMAGSKAGLKQYPWLVHINIKVRELMKIALIGCGGSLISPKFVLTAGHCVDLNIASLNDVFIILGEYDTRTFPTDCVGTKCVKNIKMHPEKIIKHEEFEGNILENDIALIKLKGSAPYTEYIRPICLPSFNIDNPKNEGSPLQISGWGSTGSQPSPVKLVAEVQLVPHRQCMRHYSQLSDGHLCAAGRNGQDTCKGDSGGPIMAQYEGNYYVVGIVSGKSSETECGSSVPTLYTNVFKFTSWIKKNMEE